MYWRARALREARRIRDESISLREMQVRYKRSFEGTRCIIIGSAPDVKLPALKPNDHYICINGSPYAASRLGIQYPHLTIMASYTTAFKTEKSKATMPVLKGLRTKEVLFIEGSDNEQHARNILDKAEFRYDIFSKITWVERAAIIGEVCGIELGIGKVRNVVSNGIFAAILAIWANADEVVMCGFSLQGGHNYIKNKFKRDHVDGDRKFYKISGQLCLPVKTTSFEIHEKCGVPLLTE
jgi:hypothetical protein